MIIVTGTKRSGTSLWMQILSAAGLPTFGEAFPRNWGKTLREANPDGFYESTLRQGIYWRTNPHPKTGDYFFPEQVKDHIVKVFIPGLVRTDRAYIGDVIATIRPWREYVASLRRLYAMEDKARADAGSTAKPPRRMPPALEWWHENYMLLRDIVTRRHRVHIQSFDGLLEDPTTVIRKTMSWLGRGDADKAIGVVKPSNRTQKQPIVDAEVDIEPEVAAVFDALYETIHRGQGLGAEFIEMLNRTNIQLAGRIGEHQRSVRRDARRRRAQAMRKRREGSTGGEGDQGGEVDEFDTFYELDEVGRAGNEDEVPSW